jgi:hypothetical protein
VAGISDGDGDQGDDQVPQFVAGQPDQPGWWRVRSVSAATTRKASSMLPTRVSQPRDR